MWAKCGPEYLLGRIVRPASKVRQPAHPWRAHIPYEPSIARRTFLSSRCLQEANVDDILRARARLHSPVDFTKHILLGLGRPDRGRLLSARLEENLALPEEQDDSATDTDYDALESELREDIRDLESPKTDLAQAGLYLLKQQILVCKDENDVIRLVSRTARHASGRNDLKSKDGQRIIANGILQRYGTKPTKNERERQLLAFTVCYHVMKDANINASHNFIWAGMVAAAAHRQTKALESFMKLYGTHAGFPSPDQIAQLLQALLLGIESASGNELDDLWILLKASEANAVSIEKLCGIQNLQFAGYWAEVLASCGSISDVRNLYEQFKVSEVKDDWKRRRHYIIAFMITGDHKTAFKIFADSPFVEKRLSRPADRDFWLQLLDLVDMNHYDASTMSASHRDLLAAGMTSALSLRLEDLEADLGLRWNPSSVMQENSSAEHEGESGWHTVTPRTRTEIQEHFGRLAEAPSQKRRP